MIVNFQGWRSLFVASEDFCPAAERNPKKPKQPQEVYQFTQQTFELNGKVSQTKLGQSTPNAMTNGCANGDSSNLAGHV